ncbi:hypothetical protein D3C80_1171280 [compost metagenome]
MGHGVTLGIDDAQVNHRHGGAGSDPLRDLLGHGQGQVGFAQVGQGQQRAGLGHPVATVDQHATLTGLAGQAVGQRAATEQDLPAAEIGVLALLAVQHHLQQGRHAVGERHPFVAVQPHQGVRLVAPGVHLLDPQHRGHVRHAPCVHMEHRRDGHVHVAGP